MSALALLIEVRFVNGRYHGRSDWPPSPFRLFQALVAGAYGGRWLAEASAEKDDAFRWLERLEAPYVAYPPRRDGASTTHYVPNNDLDAEGGDLLRVEKIRVAKRTVPRLFDLSSPVLYAWPFDKGENHAATIGKLAERLHTLGLGVDAAYARAETLSWDEAQNRLDAHQWRIARPTGGATLGPTSPIEGSLDSLKERYREGAKKFRHDGKTTLFANAAKPRFRQVAYDKPSERALFDLLDSDGRSRPWPLDRIVVLTECLRDAAAARLTVAAKGQSDTVRAVLVGRRVASEVDKSARVRIVPLPSIGHRHADRAIRRVLVEIPADCPLRTDDIVWAFSGLPVVCDDGEILCELAGGAERSMFVHYGVEDAVAARLWRTVTPIALPSSAARRRIDPRDLRDPLERKGGTERLKEETEAAVSVHQALRHANVHATVEKINVRREPFEAKGARAEAFAAPPRFAKERLWHVEIAFVEAISGPLVLGDGRYLGLGLMAPAFQARRDLMIFGLTRDARIANADRAELLKAVRRVLMALARRDDGSVSPLFSGHEADGAKAGSGHHRHIFLATVDRDRDGLVDEVLVAAPWACDHTTNAERQEHADFERVAASLATVRAGRLGVISLGSARTPKQGDTLIGPGRLWESAAPYQPTRHARSSGKLADAVELDVVEECTRRGLPRPRVEMLECSAGPNGGGVLARVRLHFVVAVEGPILIGRDSHTGGGLFETRALSAPDD